ncbi:hypothetical protein BG006_007503 [Podila minutissima]|uniref:Uncharacterized protein n=1 Tax=Podila minutissima TaxID=64525 RepID=A0A9P5VKP0_9FUNG|nr:hypothetical protein BG006_007503 [Podila minutissima]
MSSTSLRDRAAQEWPRVVVGVVSAERVHNLYFLMNQPVPLLPGEELPDDVSEDFTTVFHVILFIMLAPICLSGLYAAIMKSLRAAKTNIFYAAFAMVLPALSILATGTTGFPAIGGTTDPSDLKTLYLWLCYYTLVTGYAWSSLVLIRDCRGQPRSAFGFLKRYERLEVSDPETPEAPEPKHSEPEVEKLDK